MTASAVIAPNALAPAQLADDADRVQDGDGPGGHAMPRKIHDRSQRRARPIPASRAHHVPPNCALRSPLPPSRRRPRQRLRLRVQTSGRGERDHGLGRRAVGRGRRRLPAARSTSTSRTPRRWPPTPPQVGRSMQQALSALSSNRAATEPRGRSRKLEDRSGSLTATAVVRGPALLKAPRRAVHGGRQYGSDGERSQVEISDRGRSRPGEG